MTNAPQPQEFLVPKDKLRAGLLVTLTLLSLVGARYAGRFILPNELKGQLFSAAARITDGFKGAEAKDLGEPRYLHDSNGVIGAQDFISFGWRFGSESPPSTRVDGQVLWISRTRFNYWTDPKSQQKKLSLPVAFDLENKARIRQILQAPGFYYITDTQGRNFFLRYDHNPSSDAYELNEISREDFGTLNSLQELLQSGKN